MLKLAEDGSVSSLGSKGEDESVLDDSSVATGAGKDALAALLYEVGSCSGGDHQQVCLDSKGEDEAVLDDSSVATGGGIDALNALINQAQQNTLSNTSGKKSKRERSPTKPAKAKRHKKTKKDRNAQHAIEKLLRTQTSPGEYSTGSELSCPVPTVQIVLRNDDGMETGRKKLSFPLDPKCVEEIKSNAERAGVGLPDRTVVNLDVRKT